MYSWIILKADEKREAVSAEVSKYWTHTKLQTELSYIEMLKGLSHVQGKNWDLMKCETKDNQEFFQPEIIEFIYI